MNNWTFTSESVTEGHPDKMADQISDSILDAILEQDPLSRVACETMVTTGLCIVAGEITTPPTSTSRRIARQTISDIGYDRESFGYDGNTCGVMVAIDEQSPDIAQGVDDSEEVRSGHGRRGRPARQAGCRRPGDDVRLRGATRPTCSCRSRSTWPIAWPSAWPRSARPGTFPTCAPTARPRSPSSTRTTSRSRLKTVLISTQHNDGVDRDTEIRPDLIEHVIRPIIPEQFADDDYEVLRQPDRHVRDRRPGRRLRPHRSQDHRRHLRRHGPPRRRCVLRQGPVQGRPLGRLRRPLGRQERRRLRGGHAAARSRSPTPSAWPVRCRSSSRRSARRRSTRPSSSSPSRRSSTSVPAPSSATSTCASRCSARPRPTATSAASGFTWEDTGRAADLRSALGL